MDLFCTKDYLTILSFNLQMHDSIRFGTIAFFVEMSTMVKIGHFLLMLDKSM